MADRKNEPVHIGVVAQELLSRLDETAKDLSSDVKFKCANCEDTGFTPKGSRYEPCKRCSKQKTKSGIFGVG